jgi:hypothetical protein
MRKTLSSNLLQPSCPTFFSCCSSIAAPVASPGPGGLGVCVVSFVGHTGAHEVIWSAAMSHAHPTTTNHQAEHHKLLTALPPKNSRFRKHYLEARRHAEQLDTSRWSHHTRLWLTRPPISPWTLLPQYTLPYVSTNATTFHGWRPLCVFVSPCDVDRKLYCGPLCEPRAGLRRPHPCLQ